MTLAATGVPEYPCLRIQLKLRCGRTSAAAAKHAADSAGPANTINSHPEQSQSALLGYRPVESTRNPKPQVMALIAHLMDCKGNYGPHLIIVPNAVMVNWKAELQRWLPAVRCIYYVGTREVFA